MDIDGKGKEITGLDRGVPTLASPPRKARKE
jgi:hypothetical protein